MLLSAFAALHFIVALVCDNPLRLLLLLVMLRWGVVVVAAGSGDRMSVDDVGPAS